MYPNQAGMILAMQIPPRRDSKFNDKITDVLLPFRPVAENSCHLLRRWSLTQIISAQTESHHQFDRELVLPYASTLPYGIGFVKEGKNDHFSNRCHGIQSCYR
jgi:hypothetical protein